MQIPSIRLHACTVLMRSFKVFARDRSRLPTALPMRNADMFALCNRWKPGMQRRRYRAVGMSHVTLSLSLFIDIAVSDANIYRAGNAGMERSPSPTQTADATKDEVQLYPPARASGVDRPRASTGAPAPPPLGFPPGSRGRRHHGKCA